LNKIVKFVLDKAKKRRILRLQYKGLGINPSIMKSLKGGSPLMKKIFAIFVAMLFVASLSLAVVGCKKEEKVVEAPKVEAPVAQPAPADNAVPAPAPAAPAAPAPAPVPAK